MLKLKKLIILSAAALLMVSARTSALQYDCMRDYPLFDYRAEGNSLPPGEYVMIRSYRNVTQIVICRNHYQVIIYTDRDNAREGHITAAGCSGFDQIIFNPAVPSQREFNAMLREYTMDGMKSAGSSIFKGVKYYRDKIINHRVKIEKFEDEYVMRIEEEIGETEIRLDARWKKLIIRLTGRTTEAAKCPSVYIDQTQDKNLRRIITEFAYIIRKKGNP